MVSVHIRVLKIIWFPVRFLLEENKTDYLILDYNEETEVEECIIITESKNFLTLNCAKQKRNAESPLEYYLDEELTSKLHKHLGSYLE